MARKGKAFAWDEPKDVPFSRRENVVVLDDKRAQAWFCCKACGPAEIG